MLVVLSVAKNLYAESHYADCCYAGRYCALFCYSQNLEQGILKGEVSLYCWHPVWLVWNQLY